MRKLLILATLLFVAIAAWRIAERLSADALGMALGVLFGILAGIPAAVLVLASARRREAYADEQRQMTRGRGYGGEYPAMPQQSPVIILTGNGTPAQMANQQSYGYDTQARFALPMAEQPPQRHYRLIGEKDETLEEF